MELSTNEHATHDTRLARYAAVSTALTLLSDEQLSKRVEKATVLNTGIGGTTAFLQIVDTTTPVPQHVFYSESLIAWPLLERTSSPQ